MQTYAKRVGGLIHFRFGRFGGSIYLAKKPVDRAPTLREMATKAIKDRLAMIPRRAVVVPQSEPQPLYNRVPFIVARYARA